MLARKEMTRDEVYEIAKQGIEYARNMANSMQDNGFINEPGKELLQSALEDAISAVK